MSTFSSANITDGNVVLKECTHRIKIKYSMHQYSIHLHNLGNWLISPVELNSRALDDVFLVLIHIVPGLPQFSQSVYLPFYLQMCLKLV